VFDPGGLGIDGRHAQGGELFEAGGEIRNGLLRPAGDGGEEEK